MPSGFGFLLGAAGDLALDVKLEPLSLRVGTVAPARNEGFLCVIWSGLTFLSPFVTSEPLFNSLNTASRPPASEAGAALTGSSNLAGGGGGPGGGGGGGAPRAAGAFGAEWRLLTTSSTDDPLGFHGTPWGKVSRIYAFKSLKIW